MSVVSSPYLPGTDYEGQLRPPSSLRPGCTVVVCTRMRPASVARMIESLALQEKVPDALVVVDASPDDSTERALAGLPALSSAARGIFYARVGAPGAGLTKQRNFSLRFVATDLVAFFDDDVVLLPGCLSEMEKGLRDRSDLAGVGAAVESETVPRIWGLRRRLRIVSTLEPGRYCRSGMSVPWGAVPAGAGLVEGDWLPGCGMMWRTAIVSRLRFREEFAGYAQGEDLEFCLRARRLGRLALAPSARLRHLHEPAGRPDDFQLGYAAIANRYEIHRLLPDRTRGDVLRFAWAWSADTLLLARHLWNPATSRTAARHAAGRLAAARDLLASAVARRVALRRNASPGDGSVPARGDG